MSTVLYLNGNIYTMDISLPRAQAMAIDLSTGRILAVGSNDEVRCVGSKYTELVDLHGQTVVPGFIDAHVHLLGTAYRSRNVDASSCTSEDKVAALVRARAAHTPPGQWIQGSHWDKISGPKQTFPRKPRSMLLPLIIPLHCGVRMGIPYGATRWLYRVQVLRLRLPNQLPAQSFVMAVVSQPEFYRRPVQQVWSILSLSRPIL